MDVEEYRPALGIGREVLVEYEELDVALEDSVGLLYSNGRPDKAYAEVLR